MNYYQQQPYMNNYSPYMTQNLGYSPIQQYPNYTQGNIQNPTTQTQSQPIQQQQVPSMPVINGKIVESAEIARLQEVPYKSMAVFPRGDMREVYVKCYDDDGCPRFVTYREYIETPVETNEANTKDNQFFEMLTNISNEVALIKEKISAITD